MKDSEAGIAIGVLGKLIDQELETGLVAFTVRPTTKDTK